MQIIEAKLSARPTLAAVALIPGAVFSVTFFANQFAYNQVAKQLTLTQLRELILATTAGEKKSLPWLKLATFGETRTTEGSLRHDRNVLEVHGVELDYDGKKMPLDAAIAIIERCRLRCAIYTSPSHTEAEPKWRILAPTTQGVSPWRRDELALAVDRMFDGIFARPESFTLSQSFYYGSVNNNPAHRCEIFAGYCVDQIVNDRFADIDQRLAAMEYKGENGVHNVELSCSAIMLNRGASVDETVAKIVPAALAAGERAGEYWDREQEEATVRRMCADWLKKNPRPTAALDIDDFVAFGPQHQYIYVPSGERWIKDGIDGCFRSPAPKMRPSAYLDRQRPVHAQVWVPGAPKIIEDWRLDEGGWIEQPGYKSFNLYKPPSIVGRGGDVSLWRDHLYRIFPAPGDAEHIERFLAHRIQRPAEKINHGLLLGGDQCIGKDTILEPVKRGVGAWNWQETTPKGMTGQFTAYVQGVVLRVSEVHDLGDVTRYQFYDMMKTLTASPPDTLSVNRKHQNVYSVLNVVGVIFTTNHKTDGLYLPANDRRTYCAWSPAKQEEFDPSYWNRHWHWYAHEGGIEKVVHHLSTLDLSAFDPKATPRKTEWFWEIAAVGRSPESGPISDVLDKIAAEAKGKQVEDVTEEDWPSAITVPMLAEASPLWLAEWFEAVKNAKLISHRLTDLGFVIFPNPERKDGRWLVKSTKRTVYVREILDQNARREAAKALR
jgi:hypothetical protein